MAKLSPEIMAEMKKQGIFALATATKDGVPNVVPVGFLYVGDDGMVWVIDNYFKKTLKNIEAKESYQVKGRACIVSSGEDYEKAVAFAHAKKETYPAKNLIKIDVIEVYYTTPGAHAGDLVQ